MILTPQKVRELAKYMFDAYRLKPRYKRSSIEMWILNRLLTKLGVLKKDEWLDRYATLVGKNVYLPFIPGTITSRWDLVDQAAGIAHECQHGFQQRRDGSSKWNWRYFTSSTKRANYEADAYATSLEVYHYLGREMDLIKMAEGLGAYGCQKSDIETVKLRLVLFERMVQRGGYSTDAGKTAVKYLEGRK